MSRMSVQTFALSARKHLQHALRTRNTARFVVGNESADLDSIIGALVYGYIQSGTQEALKRNEAIIPVTNIPASDLSLRPELKVLLKHANLQPSDLITLDDLEDLPLPLEATMWTLVDHNSLLGELGKHYRGSVVGVIDHHDDERAVPQDVHPRIVEKCGSCTSLVVGSCRETWDAISSTSTNIGASHGQDDRLTDDLAYTSTWDAQLAKLALGAILIDTFNMQDENKVTDHDRKAVKYLEARIYISPKLGKQYDRNTFFDEINQAKSDLDSLSLTDILRKDYKQWTEGSLKLGISSCVKPLEYLQSRDPDFFSTLVTFARNRELHLFAIMSAYTGTSGELSRALLLFSTEEGKATEAAEKFTKDSSKELQLEDHPLFRPISSAATSKSAPWLHIWTQNNVSASRKQVGPLLRSAMK